MAPLSCLSPLALNLERRPFGPCSLHSFLAKRPSLLCSTHFLLKCGTFERLSVCESPKSRYQSLTQKLFVFRLLHTQFLLFSNTLLPQKNSANWTFFVLLCDAKITQFTAIETFTKHNGRPNKPKHSACDRPRD